MGFIDLNNGDPDAATFVKETLTEDYRFHHMSDGSFLVFKEIDEEPSYEIDSQFGCNCPAATYRAKTCKHEKMVGFQRLGEDTLEDFTDEEPKGSGDSDSEGLMDLLD